MRTVEKEQILDRIRFENPWWEKPHKIDKFYGNIEKPRAYFDLFYPKVVEKKPKRALVLMGPRRVGKTVFIHQSIQRLLDSGVSPKLICYLSIDHPIYNQMGLEELFKYCQEASGIKRGKKFYMFFDEVQYLKDWEKHLKVLVDSYHDVKFIATGSSAAALKLKSDESGAGRFTDFLLPPLTFYEYLELINETHIVWQNQPIALFDTDEIESLNEHFINYLNFGGYPEVIFSDQVKSDPSRYIKRDIIDKVLLRDLPSLYGIHDVQELNSLFTTLAYNTGNEVSLVGLSQRSGVAKNTIKRYIKYLEAAFLIKIIHRIDKNAMRFKRATTFKVYLTNPSMWSALFSPITSDDKRIIGHLAETAIFAQWFHSQDRPIYYARWKNGEVDLVGVSDVKPDFAIEIKWSDRYVKNPKNLSNLIEFCQTHNLTSVPSVTLNVAATTITVKKTLLIKNTEIVFIPTSLYCLSVGFNIIRGKGMSDLTYLI